MSRNCSDGSGRSCGRRWPRRLILLGAPSPVKPIAAGLPTQAKLALSHNRHGSVAAMFADCVNCAADYLMAGAGGPAWDREGFERLSAVVRSGLHEATAAVVTQVESALRLAHAVGARLQDSAGQGGRPPQTPHVTEVRWMLEELRVSLFAQTLGTQAPVSENRIIGALGRLRP